MKRNKNLAVILILICIILVSGCSFTGTLKDNSDRSSLSVENALIGHWISQSSEAPNYYISSDKLIRVKKDGTTEEMTYKVIETNDNTNEIKIHVTTAGGSESDNKIQFSADKKSITETTEILTVVTSTENYIYVDSKTTP